MANPSNLYAEKIFAEHPSVLWALDDTANFISYISSSVQDLTTWTATGTDLLATFSNNASPYPKIQTATTAKISGAATGITGDANTISLTSATTFSSTTEDFVISCWFYSYNSQITSIELGYKQGSATAVTQSQTISKYGDWVFVSKRFTGIVTNANAIIKINYTKSADAGEAYDFLINGLSIGYQTEEFNTLYTGLTKQTLPTTLSMNAVCAWTGTANESVSTKTWTNGYVRTNLIRNSNIEANGTGWGTRNGSNAQSSADKYEGTYSTLYTVGSSATTGGINLAPTRTSTISAVTPSSPSAGYVKYTSSNVFVAGDIVTITNLAPSGYNGTFTITEATSTYFIVANSTTATVTDGAGNASIINLLPVTAGEVYTYSIYAKDVDTSKQYASYIDWYDSTATFISGSGIGGTATTISTSDWTRVSVTSTAPSNAVYARPYTYSTTSFVSGDSGKKIYFDASMFEKSTYAGTYFNGSTTETIGGIEAIAYGGKDLSGYYIADDKVLYAKNTSVPMVYGASGVTRIIPHPEGQPSLIVPGLGFLNESGKNTDKTFEAWLRINSNATEPTRILGPINSTDGLYVHGPFLIFKIDDNTISHYVSEWFRPMLVQLGVTRNFASMTVNGETVGSMVIDTDNLASVNTNTKYDANDKDQDWIGFYATANVPSIDIDCVAIYPYAINDIVAKRRFVYGQGVKFPENLDVVYSGKSALIDYPVANYSNNYNYPQVGKWKQGLLDNFLVSDKYLSVPDYATPTITLSSGTEASWLSDLGNAQVSSDTLGSFIRIRPNSSWNAINGYLLFDNINILNDNIAAIYGIFKRDGSSASEQTLIKLENKLNGDYFKISVDGTTLYYKSYISGTATTLQTVSSIGTTFVAGIDIATLVSTASVDLTSIFRNLNYVKAYIGGDSLTSSTVFDGNIYHFGVCSERNFDKVDDYFDASGYLDTTKIIRTNLHYSPSVETNTTSFSAYNISLSKSSDFVWINLASLKGTISSTGTNRYIDSTRVSVTQGKTYTFSTYIYLPETNTADSTIRLEVHPYNGTAYGSPDVSASTVIERGVWTRLSVTTTAGTVSGSPTTSILPRITITSSIATGQLIYVDGNMFEESSVLNDYIATQEISHTPSYGVFLNTDLDIPTLDIISNSYWEDYIPLSILGKYVSNSSGTTEYDIDFIQFNIDYPQPEIFNGSGYDTSNSIVETSVTFKYLDEGVITDPDTYTTIVPASKNLVVQPGSGWETTKYAVVNGSVIYMPTVFDESRTFENVGIVVHVEANVNGIKRNPLKIKSLELASKALDDNLTGTYTPINHIGTKLGTKIYPYKTVSGELNYKEFSPYSIYKGTSPYLYLTGNTGLKVVGEYDSTIDRGLLVKINERSLDTYNISTMQVALMNNVDSFTSNSEILFEIKDKNGTITFYIDSINSANTRARIYAEQNGSAYTALKYYWNGQLVNEPTLNVKEWGILGIVFTELLDFSSTTGTLKIKSSILFDLLSIYQIDEASQKLQLIERTWFEVNYPSSSDTSLYPLLEGANTYLEWDWEGSASVTWKTLAYKMVESETFVDPNKIYQTYIGTNKIIVDSNNSSGKLRPHLYTYSIYQNGLVENTFTPEPA